MDKHSHERAQRWIYVKIYRMFSIIKLDLKTCLYIFRELGSFLLYSAEILRNFNSGNYTRKLLGDWMSLEIVEKLAPREI